MSDTSWTPAKIAAINDQVNVYNSAQAALAALNEPGAVALVTLNVSSSAGTQSFSFNLNISDAQAFFGPVVQNIGAALTSQGVTLA